MSTNSTQTGGEENPGLLWSPAQLADRLGDPNLRLIDVRPGERYTMGHLPGACHCPIYPINFDDRDEAAVNGYFRLWASMANQGGVGPDNIVVVYGEEAGALTGRGFWLMEMLGHEDAHILDGGLSAWRRAGHAVTRDADVVPGGGLRADHLRRDRLADYRDLLAAGDRDDTVILDCRSEAEFRGHDVRAARGGTIPGAVNLEWLESLSTAGELLSPEALRDAFARVGATPDKDVIAFCQSGFRSSHTYFVLRMLGFPRVRNYLGSWVEWANCPDLPIIGPDESGA